VIPTCSVGVLLTQLLLENNPPNSVIYLGSASGYKGLRRQGGRHGGRPGWRCMRARGPSAIIPFCASCPSSPCGQDT